EGENRINKAIGGPKKTFLQLFEGLNERTQNQTTQDLIQSLFAGPLKMLRDHAGPLALQTCYKQMQLSLFYSTEVMQRPHEVDSWRMINSFENDRARVSMRWVISLITKRSLTVHHILIMSTLCTRSFH
ncbi:hypothetical protein DFH08DRAFT_649662, partial [Mycena albidolilacea]